MSAMCGNGDSPAKLSRKQVSFGKSIAADYSALQEHYFLAARENTINIGKIGRPSRPIFRTLFRKILARQPESSFSMTIYDPPAIIS